MPYAHLTSTYNLKGNSKDQLVYYLDESLIPVILPTRVVVK